MPMLQELIEQRKAALRPRPLKGLDKERLLKYQDADPSVEAAWDFGHEVLARRAAGFKADNQIKDLERSVTMAQGRIRQAIQARGKAKEEDKADAEREVEAAKKVAVLAEEALEDYKLKASQDQGLMSVAEITAYYVKRYGPAWGDVLFKWHRADLLKAQRYGWGSFLLTDTKTRNEDERIFKEAEQVAYSACQENSREYRSMRALWISRIMPAIPARQRFVSEDGGMLQIDSLDKSAQRDYWRWWRDYHTATVYFSWMDDSGVAYDKSKFEPPTFATDREEGGDGIPF